ALISDQALRRIIITGRADLHMPGYSPDAGRPKDFTPLTGTDVNDLVALLAYWRGRGGGEGAGKKSGGFGGAGRDGLFRPRADAREAAARAAYLLADVAPLGDGGAGLCRDAGPRHPDCRLPARGADQAQVPPVGQAGPGGPVPRRRDAGGDLRQPDL